MLTQILCGKMERSLWTVLLGAIQASPDDDGFTENRTITRYTPEDAVLILESVQSVIIIPGYGFAVAEPTCPEINGTT